MRGIQGILHATLSVTECHCSMIFGRFCEIFAAVLRSVTFSYTAFHSGLGTSLGTIGHRAVVAQFRHHTCHVRAAVTSTGWLALVLSNSPPTSTIAKHPTVRRNALLSHSSANWSVAEISTPGG